MTQTALQPLPGAVLLLSGGHDSTALAAALRPDMCLTIDYGQRAAGGESRAARAVSAALRLPWETLRVDLSPVGSGLMHTDHDTNNDSTHGTEGDSAAPSPSALPRVQSPSPEWWPYRNQALVTLAAAWALPRGYTTLVVGSVSSDGARHVDGTATFYDHLDAVLRMQEGGLRVVAPAVGMTAADLVTLSGVTDDVLAFAHSCHVADLACGYCPGCVKQETTLRELDRLQT